MRQCLMGTVVAFSVVLVGCAAQPAAPDTEAMVAAANALDQSFLAAFNAGDVAAMNELYWNSPDNVSLPPDALVLRGYSAITEGNAAMVKGMAGAKLELSESHQMPLGDAVVGWGLFRLMIPGPDGASNELIGRYTDVKAERDGRWVYILDHASVPLPPPPAE